MAETALKEGILTACGGKCAHCPTIIVPGMGQSRVTLLDENGSRIENKSPPGVNFPVRLKPWKLAGALVMPLLKMIVTRRDRTFTDKAAKAVAACFYANATGIDGKPVNRLEAVRYLKSAARCSEEERTFIYSCIPVEEFTGEAGSDHLYFLGFNSFGNNLDTAAELYDMIQRVKRETGHEKVNIVPISLGGTITVSLLEFYPQVYKDLNKIVFVVPGLNGTKLFADIYAGNFVADEGFYRDLIVSSKKGFKGFLVKTGLKLLPGGVIADLIRKLFDELRQSILLNSTVMWGSVPWQDYPALAQKLLSDEAHAEIRRQTDLVWQAQKNARANVLKCVESGVKVFDIVDYNHPIQVFVKSSNEVNGDGWVDVASASLGAVSGRIDTPLPVGYAQKNTCCQNPAHNHISPDGIIDASAGALPETTFYFRNQDHELTGENDVILKLVNTLLISDDIADVHSMPECFPQFNTGRNTGNLRKNLLPKAASVDKIALHPADAEELGAAVCECETMLEDTVVDYARFEQAEKRLKNILVKIKA